MTIMRFEPRRRAAADRALELAQRLAHRGAIHAELARQLDLGRQTDRLPAIARNDDASPARRRPCGRWARSYGFELHAHAVEGFLEQFAADQHAADLLRAGADLVQLGIAQQPPGRIIIDVAVAAQALDGLQRHLRGSFGGKQNGRGRILARAAAGIAGAPDGIDVGARGVELTYMSATLACMS
jgi:hypothetical protein